MIKINFCPFPYRRVILPIHWVDSTHILGLISRFVRVWSYEFWFVIDLLVEINVIIQQTPKLQLPSTTSKFNSISRLQEDIYKLQLSDLIFNDRGFVNFELSWVIVVMYLLIFIFDVDVV